MKKLLYLFLAITVACGGDDDNDNSNVSSLDGRWNLTSYEENGINIDLNSCDLESFMLFNETGTGTAYVYYTDYPDNPEIEPCGLDTTTDISYSETSTNIFVMTFDYGDGDVEVATGEISNNLLILTGSYEGDSYETVFTKE